MFALLFYGVLRLCLSGCMLLWKKKLEIEDGKQTVDCIRAGDEYVCCQYENNPSVSSTVFTFLQVLVKKQNAHFITNNCK